MARAVVELSGSRCWESLSARRAAVERKMKWDWEEERARPQGRPDRASANLIGNTGATVTLRGSIPLLSHQSDVSCPQTDVTSMKLLSAAQAYLSVSHAP